MNGPAPAVLTLSCPCGMKLKAPGAVPGRVGKCPRCGSMLRVPEVEPTRAPAIEAVASSPTFVECRNRRADLPGRSRSDGPVAAPRALETRLVESLGYPLWNLSGVSLLVFMPPLIWFASVPLFAIVPAAQSGTAYSMAAIIWMVPQLIILALVVGHVLLFLGQVLVTSALGELSQPRSPDWNLEEIGRGLGRWFWALVVGGLIGGLPPLVYWIQCGEIDWFDRIVLIDLIVPGMAYAQMALLSALIHESPTAANPIRVVRTIVRLGWAYLNPCLFTGACLLVLGGLFGAVLQIQNGLVQAVAYWAFWVLALYAAMVMLRRLGLFCHRHSVVLDWSYDRARAEADRRDSGPGPA